MLASTTARLIEHVCLAERPKNNFQTVNDWSGFPVVEVFPNSEGGVDRMGVLKD